MNFNRGPTKQAQEVILSPKTQKLYRPAYFFLSNFCHSTFKKHLGTVLELDLDFKVHLENTSHKVSKINRTKCKTH